MNDIPSPFAPFSWHSSLSRGGYTLHSLLASALFLVGFCLQSYFLDKTQVGEQAFLPLCMLWLVCALIAYASCPFALLGQAVFLGQQLTTAQINTPAWFPEAHSTPWGLLGILSTLLLLGGGLRLAALAARRQQDSGIPGWLMLAAAPVYCMLSVFPGAYIALMFFALIPPFRFLGDCAALPLLWLALWLAFQCWILYRPTKHLPAS